MDAAEIGAPSEQVLGNPFAAPEEWREAATRLQELPASSCSELHARGNTRVARRLALAMAVLDSESTDKGRSKQNRSHARLLAELDLVPEEVQRMGEAARRTRRAIADLKGSSAAIRSVRIDTWRACFGESIYEAMRYQPLIREQSVLICGETGTGKELVAQAIASSSPFPERNRAVNAAAIPERLLESELFGHKKGAFTGADADRQGAMLASNGGSFFLDEIADLPEELQVKLLRVLEERRVTPLGSNDEKELDLRFIAASGQSLQELVDRGGFRNDLYQRLSGIEIWIPPLRERMEDIPLIASSFFDRFADRLGSSAPNSHLKSTTTLDRLEVTKARFGAWFAKEGSEQAWKGNVRQLQNTVRAWVLGFGPKRTSTGPRADASEGSAGLPDGILPQLRPFIDASAPLRDLEDWYISHVFARCEYNQRKAARVLGIDRGTLARRLKNIDEQ